MSSIDQLTFQGALANFCEQRTQLEGLGRQITANVHHLHNLQQQSVCTASPPLSSASNVIALHNARLQLDIKRVIADTKSLVRMARELHAEFVRFAEQYLTESRLRMARLINVLAQYGHHCSTDVVTRVTTAINQCRSEIDQVLLLMERTGTAVLLLAESTEQLTALAVG